MLSDTGVTTSWKGAKPLSISKFTLSMPWTLQVSRSSICTPEHSHVILGSLTDCSIFLNQRMGMKSGKLHYTVTNNSRIRVLWPRLHALAWKDAYHSYTSSFCRRRNMSIILEAKKCSNRRWVRMAAGCTQLNEMGTEPWKGWELRRPNASSVTSEFACLTLDPSLHVSTQGW